MMIRYGSTWLANDDLPAFAVRVNGRRVTQEAQFLRAATSRFFARGNKSISLAFQVARQFDTLGDCENFILAHPNELDGKADLLCRIGLPSDPQSDLTLEGAVLQSVDIPEYAGVQATVAYTFSAPQVTGSNPVQALQSPLTMKTFNIGNGVDVLFTLTHNLGTEDLLVQVRSNVTGQKVYEDLVGKKIINSNQVLISFGAPPATDEYRVIIAG